MASGDYSKTQYNNGAPPAINAANLNNNENKTSELDTEVAAIKSGAVTLTGVKTFSSSPIVPAATTDTQAVNKGQVALLAGDQTIAGVKTFSSSPIVPAATTAGQAVNKEQVEKAIATAYGITWDESTDAYVRTGINLAGRTLGVKPPDDVMPVHARMRRCLVNDAGEVQYYLFPTNSNLKADGVTASVLTGADGQVMVEIPKFYFKYTSTGNVHSCEVSTVLTAGFEVHPMFVRGAIEDDYVYVGAYEGALFDVSGGVYTDGNASQVKDFANDKLSSVSGFFPVTNGTRANFRKIASNRGTNWTQETFAIRSGIQLLYLIEYGSFNSQSVIGAGITNVTDWAAYNNYYPVAKTGNANSSGGVTGNTAGSASCATESTKYMTYRGIENFYGNIWTWLDGLNVLERRSWINNTPLQLADDTTANYFDIGTSCPSADGYQSALIKVKHGFLPSASTGSSSTKITDYYWQNTGYHVAFAGGGASNGATAGCFCLNLLVVSAHVISGLGGRLCYRR